jgi:hypothetical protein
MIDSVDSDHGTVLEKGSVAIMVDKEGKWSLLIPAMQPKEIVPKHVILLTCMMVKGERDQEWGDDLIEEVMGVLM